MTKADKINDITEKLLHEVNGEGLISENVIRLVSELRIYQSELEMQNKELQKAQLSLNKSRRKYVDLYNFSPVGLFTLNKELIITNVNMEGTLLLDRDKNEIINTYFVKFLTEDSKIKFPRCMKRTLETMENQKCEIDFKREDSTIFHSNVKARVIIDENGHFNGFQIAVNDISVDKMVDALKNSEKRLKKAVEDLEDFNAELQSYSFITSHDLQEPLRTMASYAGLLKKRYKGKIDSDADDFIEYIVGGASRMQRMIIGLHNYSNLGNKSSNLEYFNANEALQTALSNLRYIIKDHHAYVTWDPLPEIYGDKEDIAQVFQNLIDNALKFRKEVFPPRIHISVQQSEDEWIFSVNDNGIGIEEQYYHKIFEVFKRLHPIGKYPGVGIGLAIAKRIITLNEGRIWVESRMGIGSTFYFTLHK